MAHRNVEEEIDRLNLARTAPPDEAAALLRKALADRVNLIVAKAAKLAVELELRGLVPDLVRAFDRLMEKPVERDPQCWGKNAVSKALVALGYREATLYLRALRLYQMEPVWGRLEDTAATVRGSCALALPDCEDITRAEVFRHLVYSLTDCALPVRSDAARALAQMQGEEAILLLRLKARMGDEESEIAGQVFDYLLQLERDEALPFVAEFLTPARGATGEEAALALGSCRLPGAVALLREAWTRERDEDFRVVLLRALSATRQPEALEFLLNMVRTGRAAEAAAALDALALHRDSADIRRQVEEAAGSREPELRQQFQQAFSRAENA